MSAGLTSRFPLPRIAAGVALTMVAYGYLIATLISSTQLKQPLTNAVGVFHRLFALHEPIGMLPLLCCALLVYELATRPLSHGGTEPDPSGLFRVGARATGFVMWGLMAAVLVITLIGTHIGMEHLALSLDEFNADFEARILLAGHFRTPVPDEWHRFMTAIKPGYVSWQPADGVWLSSYLPGNALMRAFVARLSGVTWITSPLLATLSVPLIVYVSRRLWPDQRWRAVFSSVALVTSSQFLATSMTAYALSAHLVFNLLFLGLYLQDNPWGKRLAPLVGALALGLHNPFPHALFVVPFLIRLLRDQRFPLLAWWVFAYGVASAGWLAWLLDVKSTDDAASMITLFAVPGLALWVMQGMNLVLLMSWQSPVVALLALTAMFGVKNLKPVERDLVFGILLTFAFYVFFPSDQGHGWGYRYTYSVLGSIALVSTSAVSWLMQATSVRATRRLVLASFAASLLLQVPHRAWEVFSFVQPVAHGMRSLAAVNADVVLVDTDSIWYGLNLVRNDPLFERRPVIAARGGLSAEDEQALRDRYGPRLRVMTTDELVAMGFERVQPMPIGSGQRAP